MQYHQIAELFYGIAGSAELAYSTYIYAQVDKAYYKRVTSQTSSARLAGKFFGGLVAQLLVSFQLMNYHQLNYITLTCISIGALTTLFLPSVKANRQFYVKWEPGQRRTEAGHEVEKEALQELKEVDARKQIGNDKLSQWSMKKSLRFLLLDLKTAYGNGYILKWSLWWAIASAGQYQVINYIQALWDKIREEGGNEEPLYNGLVKALHTSLSK